MLHRWRVGEEQGCGKNWSYSHSEGAEVLQLLALQIDACSSLWLTVIYIDPPPLFSPQAKISTHFFQSSHCVFVFHLELLFVSFVLLIEPFCVITTRQ